MARGRTAADSESAAAEVSPRLGDKDACNRWAASGMRTKGENMTKDELPQWPKEEAREVWELSVYYFLQMLKEGHPRSFDDCLAHVLFTKHCITQEEYDFLQFASLMSSL